MDILLLNSSFHTRRRDKLETITPHLRIGVASIAGHLRQLGAEVAILDPQVRRLSAEAAVSRIVSASPRYLCLPAYTEEVKDAARIAEMVKSEAPYITTVVGGYHVSALPIETLGEFDSFDIGVVGEGERPLGDLVRGQALASIPGIVYRAGTGDPVFNDTRRDPIDLDRLAYPAWDLYDLGKYERFLPIEPLRSCPFDCVFCFRAVGRKVIYKRPERFVEELEHYVDRLGVSSFTFLAGTFPVKRGHGVEILERISARGLNISWKGHTRVDVVDDEVLRLMKKTGCVELDIGIESGDLEILRHSAKGITPQKSVETVRLCKKVGIKTVVNFIIGLPFETRSSILSTFRLALKVRRYVERAGFAILVPFPGTRAYDMALRNEGGIGLKTTDWSDFGKQTGFALRHAHFREGALQRYQSLLYIFYYLGAPLKTFRQRELFLPRAWRVVNRLVWSHRFRFPHRLVPYVPDVRALRPNQFAAALAGTYQRAARSLGGLKRWALGGERREAAAIPQSLH